MSPSAAIAQIEKALRPYQNAKRAAFLVGYMNTAYTMHGVDVPQQRIVAKRGFAFDRTVWNAVWKSATSFEVMSQCLLWFDYRKQPVTMADWPVLKTWVKRIDNWAHSDGLSSLYATLLEQDFTAVYGQFKTWNKSTRPWEVRASVVGLFYYARSRTHLPSFSAALSMVKGAFYHEDMYVQKGVGWCLREMYNVYPEQTYAFLTEVAVTLSPTAWQAATEKLTSMQKNALKTIRKNRKRL